MYWTSRRIGKCLPRGVALWLIISPQYKNSIVHLNQVACNLMAELQLALDTCQAENTRLKQQLNCDVSKCAITVYKQCDQAESCGTKNGVSCAYLPDGLGETECATMPCPAVAGR